MPNWAYNTIKLEFPHKTIMENFLNMFYTYGPQYPPQAMDTNEDIEWSKKKRYTMNGIVPVPKEVQERGYDSGNRDMNYFTCKTMDPKDLDGYNFQSEYWGTKWDLCQIQKTARKDTDKYVRRDATEKDSVNIDWDNLTISFYCETAWNGPFTFIKALLKEFPDVRFSGNFSEESDAYYGTMEYDPITNQTIQNFPNPTEKEYWEMRKNNDDLPYAFTEECLDDEGVEEMKSFYDMEQCTHCGKMFNRTSQMALDGNCVHCGKPVLFTMVERVIAYRPIKK